ncbi:MAG: TonB-dependent receptor family protein [Candidatus Wenzhouxiangella sp. M2_3B_020]
MLSRLLQGTAIVTMLLLTAAAGAQVTRLEPVEVTAPRSVLELDEVPASVTVIDADEIARGRPLTSLAELLAEVPGLFVQNRSNAAQDARIALRGFGARSSFGIRGVAIVVDGIPQTLPDGQSQVDAIDLAEVERIEVLRGPASGLYGNAAGGVILITTRAPGEGRDARFEQVVGRHGLLDSRAALAGGDERLGMRLSASRSEQDGFREHSAYRQYRAGVNLRWQPDPVTRVTAVADWFSAPEELDPGGVTAAVAAGTPRAARPANVAFDAGEALDQWRLGANVSHRFGDARDQRVGLTAFAFLRDFSNRLPFESGGQVAFEREFTGADAQYELDSELGGKPQRLTAGFDLRRQVDDRERFDNLGGVRGPRVLAQRERVDSIGAYVQHRLHLSPDWTLRTGIRFDEVRLDVDDRFLSNGDDSGRRTWSEWSPGLGVIWQARDSLSVFANVGTAFQTPTTTELANPEDPGSGGGFNRALDPQTARSYELGLRGRAGSRLRYEATVFRARIDDAIVSFEVPGFSGTGRDFFRNAGRSSRTGLELAGRARLAESLRLRAGYAYSDFEFDRFVTAGGDFSGNRLPGVPRHRGFASLDWTAFAGFYAGADLRAASGVPADNANTASSPDYGVVDVHAGYRTTRAPLDIDLAVGVGNLFAERYIDNVRVNAFGGRYFEPAPGRTWHVRLRLATRP